MQTAVGVFGGGDYTDRMDILPLMVANAGNSERAAISSLNCPPILAVELCREHLVCLNENTPTFDFHLYLSKEHLLTLHSFLYSIQIFCVPCIRFFGHSIRTKMNIFAFLCFMFVSTSFAFFFFLFK